MNSGPIDGGYGICGELALPHVTVHVRSFHPSAIFEETDQWLGHRMGRPWTGDNRASETDPDATSRVMHRRPINLRAVDIELDPMPAGQSHFRTHVRPLEASDRSRGLN